MSTPFLALIEGLGVQLDDHLLDLALTHRSYAYEHGQIPHNERLEFLGDAVLGLGVTDHLFATYPDYPEGQLAKLRAAVVSSVSLADIARDLKIGPMIKLGRGEIATGGDDKTSILADTMEALIGAVHLTSPEGARALIHHLFIPHIEHAATLGAGLDWKTSLQEIAAAHGLGVVAYETSDTGPDHDKRFAARAVIGEQPYSVSDGHTNKKHAEQEAAALAFHELRAELGLA